MGARKSNDRFAVSLEGMRELHGSRPLWSLVKELVQNSWDEAPESTFCKVSVSQRIDGLVEITVLDDGPGFANIRDAYTLMGATKKRLDPNKRGRFNLGEKEIVSVADEARVETVGTTVEFPLSGGRREIRNSRERGTLIKLVMPERYASESKALADMLRRFRPTDCALFVNGEEVPKRPALASGEVTLPTVLQSAPGQPMRPTRRATKIETLAPAFGDDKGWLYEMGIPVQPTECGYDVDVFQKVPLSPNRDTVGDAYLRDIYAEVLNLSHKMMEKEDFAETWARQGIEDERVTEETVKRSIRERFGNMVVIRSGNRVADLEATEKGYEVLNPRGFSPEERDALRNKGGVITALDQMRADNSLPKMTARSAQSKVEKEWDAWVSKLARHAGVSVKVGFVWMPLIGMVGCCRENSRSPDMIFNLAHLDAAFLKGRGEEQVALVIHELGHALCEPGMAHGMAWGNSTALAGAKVALGMASDEANKTAVVAAD